MAAESIGEKRGGVVVEPAHSQIESRRHHLVEVLVPLRLGQQANLFSYRPRGEGQLSAGAGLGHRSGDGPNKVSQIETLGKGRIENEDRSIGAGHEATRLRNPYHLLTRNWIVEILVEATGGQIRNIE